MSTQKQINIVWIKRDIRSQDHLPLHLAEQDTLLYIIIFLFEPAIISYPDTSLRHLQFQYHSILQLNKKLNQYNKEVIIYYTEALTALYSIKEQFEIKHIFSYQESGLQITYNRDKEVAKFCKQHNISWHECQRDGIIRGIKNRKNWDKEWFITMHTPIIKNTYSNRESLILKNNFSIDSKLIEQFENYPREFQPAGEDFAFKYLQSFVADRGKNYSKHIS